MNWHRPDNRVHSNFQRQLEDAGKFPVEMTLRIRYNGIDEGFSWVLAKSDELRDLASKIGLETEMLMENSSCVWLCP